MFPQERRQAIINLIKIKKSISVTDLSHQFFIGEATIRRDLEKLEKKGLLKRTYGGAILLDGLNSEIPLSIREIEQKDAKDVIGHLASNLVMNGNVIIMDSSSTVLKMVPFMKGKNDLTVITNGAKTAVDLGEMLHIKVYSTGGILRENSLSYIGEHARRFIDNFYADTLFFSCRAISMEKGLTEISEDEAELRRLMIKNCRQVVLLCDSSKFNQISLCRIGGFENVTCLITDQKPDDKWLFTMKERGIDVIFPV